MRPKSRNLEPSHCRSSSARLSFSSRLHHRVATYSKCFFSTSVPSNLASVLANNLSDRRLGPDWTLGQEQLPGSAAYSFGQLSHLAVLHCVCQHRFQKLQQQHYSGEALILCPYSCIAAGNADLCKNISTSILLKVAPGGTRATLC